MFTVLALMAMFVSSACPAYSQDDISIANDNTNNNTNNVTATSTATSTATGGNATATGGNSNATLNYTERQQVPQYQPPSVNVQIGSDTYGTSVAQFGNSDILGKGCRTWTMAKHRTKLGAMKKVEGAVSWDKMMDLIKAYPDIENEFAPIGEGLVYRYDSIDLAKNIGLTEENYIGILPYDTELSKDYFVPQSYLGERACYDGSQLFGANIVVKIGEFSSGHFVASGKSISGGGILSTILSCITSGGISAGIGSTGTKNSKIITTGAVYGLFRGQPRPCLFVAEKPCDDCGDLSEVFADLAMYQQKIAGCHFFSADNLSYRVPSGERNIELYACTRDQKYLRAAEKDLDWALKNYEKGSDTHVGKRAAKSLQFYRRAIILQATVLQAQGKTHEAQVHAKKYGVEHWGSDFVPARRKK